MQLSLFRWVSRSVVTVLVVAALAACGGSNDVPPTVTPAPMPTRALSPTAAAATPGTPVAGSPQASPASLTASASTITREEFKAQLLANFPIETAAHAGGSIVWGSPDDISTTNPMLASDGTTLNVLGQVFEPLLGASPIDGRPVPALADSWDVSSDGLTFTFHLNQQAKWQDGVDITADDVLFSFDAALNPNLNSPYRSQIREVIAAYRVIDADTFEITAADRFVTFLYNGPASVFIVPKHIWSTVPVEQWSFDGGSTGQDMARVVGSGPFRLTSWDPGQRVVLHKNANYYDAVPNIDEFDMVIQPQAETMVQALEQGDTDLVEILPAGQTKEIQANPELNVNVYPLQQVTFYTMNLDGVHTPAFSDARVRQAMYIAIDRQALTDSIFEGFGQPARGTQPPLSPSFDPNALQPDYAYNPDQARQLLAQAGWTDSDNDGTIDSGGKDLKLDLLYTGGDTTVDSMVQYLQDAWKAIGIKVDIVNISGDALTQRLNDHDFALALLAFTLGPDGSQGLLFDCDSTTTGFNFGSYCNQAYDDLDAQQLREFDPAKRAQMQAELAQIVWTDLPVGPIRFGVARTGYSKRIHNFFPNGYGFLWSLSYVWVDSDQ